MSNTSVEILSQRRIPIAARVANSGGALKLLPFWDPLRGDPRFEKIVASFAPKESNSQ
jgi:hypothetical protein